MAEEKTPQNQDEYDSDTLNALRYVLRSVKGISPVSTVTDLAVYDKQSQ